MCVHAVSLLNVCIGRGDRPCFCLQKAALGLREKHTSVAGRGVKTPELCGVAGSL